MYVKNWSSFHHYGARKDHPEWTITSEKLGLTNSAKVMHCLPVRRNVVIADEVLDGPNAIVIQQAENRLYAAQTGIERNFEKSTEMKLSVVKIGWRYY